MNNIVSSNTTLKFIASDGNYDLPYLSELEIHLKREYIPITTVHNSWITLREAVGMSSFSIALQGYYSSNQGHEVLRIYAWQGRLLQCELTLSSNELVCGMFLVVDYELRIDRYGFRVLNFKLESSGEIQYIPK